jgi:ABC-type phosphate transport system substrate-binding protein
MAVTDRHHHRVVSCSRIGVAAAAIAGGLVLAGAAAAAVPAYADPAPGVVPAAGDIVGVGSDTTQDLVGALANAYNNAQGAGAPKAYSWDATPKGSTIVPKSGAPSITRPDGSAAGIKALRNGSYIDFARSTSGKATDGSEDSLAYFALAQDGVTWATIANSKAPTTLTTTQLAGIYTCSSKATYWDQVGGKKTAHVTKTTKWVWVIKTVNGKKMKVRVKKTITTTTYTRNTIKPYLPPTGSDNRKFWLGALGLTESQVGPCVKQSVQENNGAALPNDPNAIAPYSIGKWIGQAVHHHNDQHGVYLLHQINTKAPTEGTGQAVQLNLAFESQFQRIVYNVVTKIQGIAGGQTAGDVAPSVWAVFNTYGYICQHPEIIQDYGFLPLGYGGGCGNES